MELSELVAYAKENYQIEEQHKWAEFPGFSVLCHPDTGKWVALLMRQWDTDSGREIERCDLKCGALGLLPFRRSYLTAPIRMRGSQWIAVAFEEETEAEIVCRLFDRAIAQGKPHGFTMVLSSPAAAEESPYRDTALPFAGSSYRAEGEQLPDRLREMRRLYEYGRDTPGARAKSFVRQARFMEDYTDDVPWTGEFICYYPTYHDLNTRQLRGYFTWRAGVRRGEFRPIPTSAAYLYVYELLNGVGGADAEDCFQKLGEFERGFLDSGIGDASMGAQLRRWRLEYAVLHDLPQALARQAAPKAQRELDSALEILRTPEEFPDEEVFSALCRLGKRKIESSPVITGDPARGKALFAQCWRRACAYTWQGKDLFTLCFGGRVTRRWYPLANAVVVDPARPVDREYVLGPCRVYRCRGGQWQTEGYERLSFDTSRLQGFLHETDALLRRYLKTGRYLKENPAEEWAVPFIRDVIEEEQRARREAARPRITIDLSGLERIRADAAVTRESLMTEADREEEEELPASPAPAAESAGDLPLDGVQYRILVCLTEGEDPSPILKEHHLMPSLAADAINEALFEEFGDTVLLCEGDTLLLVDDYTEDLKQFLGGTRNG